MFREWRSRTVAAFFLFSLPPPSSSRLEGKGVSTHYFQQARGGLEHPLEQQAGQGGRQMGWGTCLFAVDCWRTSLKLRCCAQQFQVTFGDRPALSSKLDSLQQT